jgi:hypothetical protein
MTEGMAFETALDGGAQEQDGAPVTGPVMDESVLDLLEIAWTVIANAGHGDWDSQPAEWRSAAEEWRGKYHALLRELRLGMAEQPEPEAPPLPDGQYGRIELPGYRNHTGWVTEETRFGVQMAVVRDWDGGVVAEVAPGPLCQFVHLPTPLKRPEPQERPAITRANPDYDGDGWDSRDDYGDDGLGDDADEGDGEMPF